MKKVDLFAFVVLVLFLSLFLLFKVEISNVYMSITATHPYLMAFIKFAILATVGEMLALRIKSGVYYTEEFGIFPKMVVWGLLGIWIAFAINVFATGVPRVIEQMGISGFAMSMEAPFSCEKLVGAFCISVMMNTCFAPVFMTVHKITDMHIHQHHGRLKSLIIPVKVKNIISVLDWKVQWNFVFKKTIPLFWIPAHTITFILPANFRVSFAALLSVALGLILTFASLKSTK
ncbi:MAG: hypothetical protein LBG80_07885 [Bacteroidales bacterium]|jgi:hypothetical protein|nr:hypothetical protein [Bacteroidales bacterium]